MCRSQHCISSVLIHRYSDVFAADLADISIICMYVSSALYHMQCHMSYPVYGLIGLQPSHRVRMYMHVST